MDTTVAVALLTLFSILGPCSGLCSITPDPAGHVSVPFSWNNISSRAFYECWALRSITIDGSITSVGEAAFMRTNLSIITLPSSVTRIEKRAFYATKLTRAVVSASLRYLGDEAYGSNPILSYVEILSGNLTSGEEPFANCDSLTAVSVEYSKDVFIKGSNLGTVIGLQCAQNTLSCGCMPGYGNEISNTSSSFNCVPCTLGESNANSPPGVGECKKCSFGTYAQSDKSSSCTGCPAGKYGLEIGATDDSVCRECEIGKYQASSQGFKECKPCPPGNFCNTTGMADYYSCRIGTFQNQTWGDSCFPCPAGRYQDMTGGAVCSACSAGKSNPQIGSVSASSCAACGSGEYSNFNGASECQKCPKDSFPSPSKQRCESCPDGKTTVGVTTDGTGADYCVVNKLSCSQGEERDMSTGLCVSCATGKYSDDGNACNACPSSTYSDTEGTSLCTPCPTGRYGKSPSTSKSSADSACTFCPKGTFVDHTGASTCSACPPGSACPDEGMTSPQPCSAGTYSEFSNLVNCPACPAGRYQSKQGAAGCSLCGVGRYIGLTGSKEASSCRECVAGRFASSNGSAMCDLCPVGHYQTAWGQASCLVCEDGKTSRSDRIGCEFQDEPASTKNGEILFVMFGEGVALYSAFVTALFFVAISVFIESIRDKNKELARQGYVHVCVRGFMTGFVLGAEVFIIYGMWSDSPPLGATILMFRLFHFFGAIFVIAALSFPESDTVTKRIGNVIQGAAELRSHLEPENMEDSPSWAVFLSLMSALDLTILRLLPWKASAFFTVSGGLPTMGLFNFVFFVKTCQSTLAIIAEIAYIASYNNLHDSTTSSEAEALFGLSIVCLFWEMLTMLAIYVEYGDRLREIEKSFAEDQVARDAEGVARKDFVPEPITASPTNNFDVEMNKVRIRMHENPMHQAQAS